MADSEKHTMNCCSDSWSAAPLKFLQCAAKTWLMTQKNGKSTTATIKRIVRDCFASPCVKNIHDINLLDDFLVHQDSQRGHVSLTVRVLDDSFVCSWFIRSHMLTGWSVLMVMVKPRSQARSTGADQMIPLFHSRPSCRAKLNWEKNKSSDPVQFVH